jgi:hypothetical protein
MSVIAGTAWKMPASRIARTAGSPGGAGHADVNEKPNGEMHAG